jgi:uncharacterized protein YndB with AHSA1/START domain
MKNKSYTATIEVDQTPEDVFNRITDVSKWWSKDFEGHSAKLNDEFTILHAGAHYSKQKLFEVIPNKKMVWLVTESHLDWLEKNKGEWTNTKMIFEITSKGDKTVLDFTHEGLVPEKECHSRCAQGWDMVIKEWLFNFITRGKEIGSMKSEFVYVSYIKTTPDKLWRSLTSPEIAKQWWGGGINIKCDWKKGSPWAMSYDDGRPADAGEILEVDPPGRMVIRWRNESNPELKEEGFSRCAIELEAMNGAVKLTVRHELDCPNSKFIAAVSSGWPLILSNLKSLLETGEVVLKERTDSYGRSR